MNLNEIINIDISRLSFLFLIYTIITGGELQSFIPCQTRRQLKHNTILKHILGIILIFGFIMLEGGWEFTNIKSNITTDWTNGNSVDTVGWSIILYFFFLLTSKMNFIHSSWLFILILILYIINTYKNNLLLKQQLSKNLENNIQWLILIILIILIIIFVVGIYNYYNYKKNEYKKKFTLFKFIFNINRCKKK